MNVQVTVLRAAGNTVAITNTQAGDGLGMRPVITLYCSVITIQDHNFSSISAVHDMHAVETDRYCSNLFTRFHDTIALALFAHPTLKLINDKHLHFAGSQRIWERLIEIVDSFREY